MKVILLLLISFLSNHCFSQDSQGSIVSMRALSPFKDTGFVVCPRDWMMPRERMDALKQEVKVLEQQLVSLSEKPFGLGSVSYIHLYRSEHEVRIEAYGEINELFCVSDNEAGKEFTMLDSGEATFVQMQVYGDKYLVITSEYYYLGNCEKLTTVKEYYIRKDYRK